MFRSFLCREPSSEQCKHTGKRIDQNRSAVAKTRIDIHFKTINTQFKVYNKGSSHNRVLVYKPAGGESLFVYIFVIVVLAFLMCD